MAKRKGPPGLRAALKSVDKMGAQMNREASADYGVAMSANLAGVANLRKQVGRLERNTLGTILYNQTNLQNLAAGARKTQRSTRGREAAAVATYGGALGRDAARSFRPAKAVAESDVAMSKAAVKQGEGMNRIATTVMALAEQGVSAQQAAAEYGLATALQQRNIVDSGIIAQLTGDLYKMAIQYNMEWQMWKKQQDYAKKLADKEDKGGLRQLRADVGRLVDEGSLISVGAAEAWREWRDAERAGEHEEGAKFNIAATAQEWAANQGFDPAGPEAQVFMAVLRNVSSGMTTDAAYESAMETLYQGLPGWDKWGTAAVTSGMAKIRLELLASLTNYTDASQNAPAPGDEDMKSYGHANPFAMVFDAFE